ncbi:protein of unknown function [Pararobbsia alpina]
MLISVIFLLISTFRSLFLIFIAVKMQAMPHTVALHLWLPILARIHARNNVRSTRCAPTFWSACEWLEPIIRVAITVRERPSVKAAAPGVNPLPRALLISRFSPSST